MLAVDVRQLRKEFKVQQNREGLKGALRDLFDRRYRHITAVNDISFSIPQGEICGYIGENGAGKSTTIKMLTGILVPTSGYIRVNGFIPYKERETFVRGIGVVFGQRSQLWWDIGVIESFQLLRKVYRVGEADFKRRLDELVERLALGDLLNRPVRKLSLGQRMRCELAASLLHNPSVLFLDEPTIGLDIVVKTEIRQFLKSMNERYGTTILLTTHDLQDIEALCSRVIMLDDGRIIYDGGLDELKARWGKGKEIVFQFTAPVELASLEQLTAGLGVEWSRENDFTAKVWVPADRAGVSDVMGRVVGAMPIQDIKINEPNTDDIVREIYKSGSAEAGADAAANAGTAGAQAAADLADARGSADPADAQDDAGTAEDQDDAGASNEQDVGGSAEAADSRAEPAAGSGKPQPKAVAAGEDKGGGRS